MILAAVLILHQVATLHTEMEHAILPGMYIRGLLQDTKLSNIDQKNTIHN